MAGLVAWGMAVRGFGGRAHLSAFEHKKIVGNEWFIIQTTPQVPPARVK